MYDQTVCVYVCAQLNFIPATREPQKAIGAPVGLTTEGRPHAVEAPSPPK